MIRSIAHFLVLSAALSMGFQASADDTTDPSNDPGAPTDVGSPAPAAGTVDNPQVDVQGNPEEVAEIDDKETKEATIASDPEKNEDSSGNEEPEDEGKGDTALVIGVIGIIVGVMGGIFIYMIITSKKKQPVPSDAPPTTSAREPDPDAEERAAPAEEPEVTENPPAADVPPVEQPAPEDEPEVTENPPAADVPPVEQPAPPVTPSGTPVTPSGTPVTPSGTPVTPSGTGSPGGINVLKRRAKRPPVVTILEDDPTTGHPVEELPPIDDYTDEETTCPRPMPSPGASTEPAPEPEIDPADQQYIDELRVMGPGGTVAAILAEAYYGSLFDAASGFKDPETLSDFEEWFENGLVPRIMRFQTEVLTPNELIRLWVEPDLVTALDKLGGFLSIAARDHFEGHAPAKSIYEGLYSLLYDQLGPACETEEWFILDRIEPFKTPFDPTNHVAGGRGEFIEGASGLIIMIQSMGRLDLDEVPIERAKVLIGL